MLPAVDALDRDVLHLFVAGPGPGEGLALALPRPDPGWVFVDGCRTGAGTFPLHEIWRTYRLPGEPALGVVLTHPHQDHYEGMVELIDLTSPLDATVPLNAIQPPAPIRVPGATFKALVGPSVGGPLDAVWLFSLDATGHSTSEHRGDRALKVGRRQ